MKLLVELENFCVQERSEGNKNKSSVNRFEGTRMGKCIEEFPI